MSSTAYVALGSNMGDSEKNIRDAVAFLDNVPGIKAEQLSDIYKTKPWGYEKQSDFLNACVRLSVEVSPEALLGACLGIEAAMGRVRSITNGPRVIDIDVIYYIGESRSTKELILPHPRVKERDFVLVPLLQVALDDIKEETAEYISRLEEHYIIE